MPLADRLERRALEALVGRRAELERLEVFASGDEPLVMHMQGIPGIGKTHLLNALAAHIGGKGVSIIRVHVQIASRSTWTRFFGHNVSIEAVVSQCL
jgi:DNA replication protein DnaC